MGIFILFLLLCLDSHDLLQFLNYELINKQVVNMYKTIWELMTCKKFVGAGKFDKLTLSKVMNLVCTISYKKYITDILYVMSMIKGTS